ncbi:MAG: hypothetical protein IT454_07315 [Planctomycetes bacterium]|nr:hypothetical protein [Planctomycetota bacterium]
MHRRKAAALRVFVSRPTTIEPPFEREYSAFERHLVASGLESQRLGRANYSKKAPLLAVREILAECAGAIVLGYPHTRHVHRVVRGVTTTSEFGLDSPTPWNQIEGALAYGQGLPLLVVAHSSISGGIFDHGVTGEMVLTIDLAARGWFKTPAFRQPFEEFLVELRARAAARSR